MWINNTINIKDVGKKQFEALHEIQDFDKYEDFIELLIEWLTYKSEIKKPIGKTSICKTLREWKKLGPTLAKEKVDKAITNGWQGWSYSNKNLIKTEKDESTGTYL